MRGLDPELGPVEQADAIAGIEAEEAAGDAPGVAGFDYTFSIPKSASVQWAVAGVIA